VASGEWGRGVRILRSAPWVPVLGATGTAVLLLVVAALAHGSVLGPLTAVLGFGACGGASAYLLDEEAGPVADASPTSRRHRLAWRLVVLAVPAAVALGGLALLDAVDPSTHWWRLALLVVGALAAGAALAAALRRNGFPTPGDQASVLVLIATVLLFAADPLRRWVSVAPLGDAPHLGRSVALWSTVTVACAVVTLGCTRDPGRRR
jgi:hypothetical protein